jgi:hypothetical protein
MLKVKKLVRSVKNSVKDYDDVQLRVREATSNDPKGADERLLSRIANDTRDRFAYDSVFSILWKRLTDLEQPSHIIKALILTEYLLKHGDPRFVSDVKCRKRVIKQLTGYKYYKAHADVGGGVREQAKDVMKLLGDDALELNSTRDSSRRRGSQAGGGTIGQNDTFFNRFGDSDIIDHSSTFNDPLASETESRTNISSGAETMESAKLKKSDKNGRKKKSKKNKQRSASSFDVDFADMNSSNTEMDIVTGFGAGSTVAPTDWISSMKFSSEPTNATPFAADFRSQDAPNILMDSGRGSVVNDGYVLDSSMEVEPTAAPSSPVKAESNDIWTVAADLTQLDDLRMGYYGYQPPSKPKARPTTSGPKKTLKELAQQSSSTAAPLQILPMEAPTLGAANSGGHSLAMSQPYAYGYSGPMGYSSGPPNHPIAQGSSSMALSVVPMQQALYAPVLPSHTQQPPQQDPFSRFGQSGSFNQMWQ